MFCQYQYYRDTEKLQAAVNHKTNGSEQQVIEKIPWEVEARVHQAEDQAGEEGDTAEREEGDGGLTSRPREREDSELNRARSLRDRVKRIFKR